MKKCGYKFALAGLCIAELRPAAGQLPHGMQLAKKKLATAREHAGCLSENRLDVFDVFKN